LGIPKTDDPYALFADWWEDARASKYQYPDAMSLATAGADGMPAVRIVLLKEWDERGFVFYTNMASAKSRDLEANPQAALCLYWEALGRQVRARGPVERVDDAQADAYFASRPRDSQLGAWASKQSQPLEGRFALEKRVAVYAAKYPLGSVPRPPFWSGWRVLASEIEFWQEGAFRLHDRVRYERAEGAWHATALFP